jgi:hypothetical protein
VQSALQQLDQLQQGYFPLTGGVLTGWARTTNGTAAAPALQIGAADAGFWKLGATMFLGAGGVAVMQYSATAVTAQVPMTLPADPISNLQAATKQYVDNKVSVTTPTMNGTAAVGTFTTLARADHVHPSDTSKYAASNPSNYQTGAQVTASLGAYYTAATSDGRYVYKSGDTITGGLNVNGTVNVGGQVDATGSFNSVNGYICQAGISAAKGSSVFNIFWNGTPHLYIDASYMGQFTFVSDYRIKRDVVPLGAMWEAIKALRPVSYKHKDYTPPNETRAADDPFIPADDVERWGFIAHELQETLTANAATGEKDQANCIQSPNPWTVLAAVTRALQEAMARIEVLEGLVTK